MKLTMKTLFIVWPHRPSEKGIKARTLSCWHPGESHVMPGALPFITYHSKHPPRVTSQFVSVLPTSRCSLFLLIQDSAWLMLLSFPVPLRDPYLIALRSVTLPTHPPSEDYTRGEVLCAGFTILEQSSIITKVGQTRRARSSERTQPSTVS